WRRRAYALLGRDRSDDRRRPGSVDRAGMTARALFGVKIRIAMLKELTLVDSVSVPEGVVSRELDGETVLLNLDTGIYFGLDAVATDMWRAMHSTKALGEAVETVRTQYAADPVVLRDDLLRLANQMLTKGLLQVGSSTSPPSGT